MLTFKALDAKAMTQIEPYLTSVTDRLCDLTPGAVLMWHEFYRTEYAFDRDCLFFRVWYGDRPAYILPMGANLEEAFHALLQFSERQKDELILTPVSESGLAFLRTLNAPMKVKPQRNWFDYLYNAADLQSFSGKKFHGQRGHANRFRRTYPDWSFAAAQEEDIPEIADFLGRYFTQNPPSDKVAAEEQTKTAEVFRDPQFGGMLTGVLRAEGTIAAVSAGEVVGDTLFVHIEKADIRFAGVYPAIVQSFAQAYAGNKVAFINREEDMGLEGLRQSKMSYHPIKLLEKNLVYWGVSD